MTLQHLSYADDTRLSRAVSGVTDASVLQTDLEKVYQWAIDNNMVFNAKKSSKLLGTGMMMS